MNEQITRKIVCSVLVRRLHRFLNNTWAADALPGLTRKSCLPTCLPFRIADIEATQGLSSLSDEDFNLAIKNRVHTTLLHYLAKFAPLIKMFNTILSFRKRDPHGSDDARRYKYHKCIDNSAILLFI